MGNKNKNKENRPKPQTKGVVLNEKEGQMNNSTENQDEEKNSNMRTEHHQSVMDKIRSAIDLFLFGPVEEHFKEIEQNLTTSIDADVQELNKYVVQLNESVKDVHGQVTQYVNRIQSLQEQIQQLKKQNSELNKEKETVQNENTKLKKSNEDISRDKDRLEYDKKQLQTQYSSLQNKYENAISDSKRKYDEEVKHTHDEAFVSGKKIGIEEGLAKGVEEGRAQALSNFMGLMTSKFSKIVSDPTIAPEYAMRLVASKLEDLNNKVQKVEDDADRAWDERDEALKKIKLLETTTDVGAMSLQLDEEKKKVEELEGNLENERNKNFQLSNTINEKNSKLEALGNKIKTEEEEWGKERDGYIENEKNLKQKHADELNKLKSDHQNKLSMVRSDYEEKTAQLKTQMADQKKSYEEKIKQGIQQHENEIKDLKNKQQDKIDQINSDHASKVKEMEEKHASSVKNLNEQHELAVNQLNNIHRTEVDQLNQEHDKKIAQLNLSLKSEQEEKRKVSDILTNETDQFKQSTITLAQQLLNVAKQEDVILSCGDFDEIAKDMSEELANDAKVFFNKINDLGVSSTPTEWYQVVTSLMTTLLESRTSIVNRVMKYYCLSSLPFMIDKQRESGMYFNRKQIKKMYNLIIALLDQCNIKVHIPALFVENVRDDDYETDNTFNDVETFCPGGIKEHVRNVERDEDGKKDMIVGLSRIGYTLPDGTVVKTKVIV